MGTWAIQPVTRAARPSGMRQRLGLMLASILRDDDEDAPGADLERRIWPKPPPESHPYLEHTELDSMESDSERSRHVARQWPVVVTSMGQIFRSGGPSL